MYLYLAGVTSTCQSVRPKALQALFPYVILFVMSLLIFLPIMKAATGRRLDFGSHIRIAEALLQGIKSESYKSVSHISHVLCHAVYKLLKDWLPQLEPSDIALLTIMVFITPLPMIIFSIFKRNCVGLIAAQGILLLSVGLTIASPITIWADYVMIGYINPIVYHNPTLIALRLFAIPVSLLALSVFSNTSYRNANHQLYTLLLCASVILLSTLAKQSYTLVLIPGCCAFAAWRIFRGNRVDGMLLVFGICIPGSLMLGLQYLISYVGSSDSTISFGVFAFFRNYIPDWRVPVQLALSLAFPLTVYLLYFAEARKHLYLNFSWTVFAVSAMVSYCLYETGDRIYHGNFLWNSYITVFVLMFASLQFLVQQYGRSRLAWPQDCRSRPPKISLKLSISVVLFGAHVFFGIGYYIRFMTGYVPQT